MDKRVVRTKARIRKGLLELMKEKELTRITVKELAEGAGINRKTFYVYYNRIEDVMDELEDELVASYQPLLDYVSFKEGKFNEYVFMTRLNDIIRDQFEIYEIMGKAGWLPHLISRVKDLFVERIGRQLTYEDGREERYLLYADYVSAGLLSMVSKWMVSQNMSLEDLTSLAARVILAGLASLKV